MNWAAIGQFHFVRPWWLLALLPCVAATIWLWRRRAGSGMWHQLIEPQLLQVLMLPDEAAGRTKALPLLFCGWLLAVLALAGPSWERLPQPVQQRQDALIVALDLGITMNATDLQPSRLERARFKIEDVLAMRREGFTALIVYAGDAHVVTPLSDDVGTVRAMLPALSPEIMPSEGKNVLSAVQAAERLLRGAGIARGRMLLITDSAPRDTGAIAKVLDAAGISLSLLGVGTPGGAPVPLPQGGFLRNMAGGIEVAALDDVQMRRSAAELGARFTMLSVDDADLRTLLPDGPLQDRETTEADGRVFDQWLDRGPWLALALLPLASLAFRRGWLLCLPLLLLGNAPRAEALEWRDLWLRRDQQGAQALEQKDAARAAELFDSAAWRGQAQYANGDYGGAAESWAKGEGADAHYNRGNALARAGKLQEALAAYDAALATRPDMEDATANRELVEKLLQQQQQQQQSGQDGQQQSGSQQSQQGDQGQQGNNDENSQRSSRGEQQAQKGSRDQSQADEDNSESESRQGEQQSRDPEQDASSAQEQQNQVEPRDATDAKQQAKSAADRDGDEQQQQAGLHQAEGELSPEQMEKQQALEQWLRQVPDDPGELLRRKFEYEYRRGRNRATEE